MADNLRSRRLQKELKLLKADFIQFVELSDGDLGKWQVMLDASSMPDYLGAVSLHITFPPEYPFKPPSIHIPSVFHPNVYCTDKLCISTLDQGVQLPGTGTTQMITWRPSLSLLNILYGVKWLLETPNPSSPANVDASRMFKNDLEKYKERNRELRVVRDERHQREQMLREQQVMFDAALAADQAKASARDQAKVLSGEAGEVDKPDIGGEEMAGDQELESNRSFEEDFVSGSSRIVVQPIKTKTGREMFKFKTGETEPCVGDLRKALKRKRSSNDTDGVELRTVISNKVEILEIDDDWEALRQYSKSVIIVDYN